MTEKIFGTIETILYHSSETGFTIFKIKPETNNSYSSNKNNIITCKGYLANLQIGQDVTLSGEWVTHTKFGRQFSVSNCITKLPNSITGLKKYLGSGLIKGIGKVYATKIVDFFGENTLEIIENSPEKLRSIPGIGQERAKLISSSWDEQKEISNIMIFLQEKDISATYAVKIYKRYNQNSIAVLTENPYKLSDDIWGIGFKVADQIAYKMGVSKESPKRISAGLIYSITTEISNGHLYIELENLKQITKNILELDLEIEQLNKLLKLALHNLYEQEKIKLISHNNKHYIALSKHYFSEKNLSEKILTLNDHKSNLDFDITKIYQDLRNKDLNNINLNSEQQEAIIACLQNKVSVITGGPGTGKTTIIKSLLNILDQNNIIYKLAAPTGRAAKRITESTKRQASTLHRLLEFDFISAQFSRNESNTLEINFLIIDEASMLDVFLAYAVLRALNLNTHLVLIGDIDQLPSVGPGNFLKDLINSNVINITKLKDIFRQAQDSLIITNAHKINQGLFPESNKNKDDNSKLNDFIFIKEDNPENLPSYLNKIIHGILPKYNINNYNSIVLSPMHKGSAGTQKLNLDLQNILNKNSQKQINFGQYNYKLNDRVMQLRNNYDKAVFNGDIGIITDINLESKALFIKYDYRTIEYSSSELDELTLAYAISIHKSQGSEYDAVIIPVFTQHFTLLQRNLIYTAITRAKKLCIFIGQPKAMAIGINNHKSLQRCTFLPEFLTTDLQAR